MTNEASIASAPYDSDIGGHLLCGARVISAMRAVRGAESGDPGERYCRPVERNGAHTA